MSALKSPRRRPIYLWHPEIHSGIGNEKLLFILASFDPVYKRGRVVGEIKRALTDLKIRSYTLWELIGDHDILIQAWVPAALRIDRFQSKLYDYATVEVETMPMAVDTIVHHWMWKTIDIDKAEAEISSEDYGNLNEGFVPAAKLRKYLEAGYIHAILDSRRLKFFIRITNPHKPTSRSIDSQIRDNIKKLFDKPIFSHGVVMRVAGGASYLITGRLVTSSFPALGEDFHPIFADSGVLESLRCRTITHLSVLYEPVAQAEQLMSLATPAVAHKVTDQDLKLWLTESESDYLEFKASAFTDVDHKVGRKNNARSRADQVHEIARAVVGMLNAAGGTVVIGVAELDKYPNDQLMHPYPAAVRVKDHVVIGVDSEFPRGGWDAYQRSLANALRKAVDGEIGGWMTYQNLQYEGRSVCVIRVRRPPTFYYVNSTDRHGSVTTDFFGRMGGETRLLRGRQMDEFKEAHPRIITRGSRA